MVTIRITGPECSGKSSLAAELHEVLGGTIVHEAAREYLNAKKSYDQANLIEIAKIQKSAEDKIRDLEPSFLIADTGMLVLSIWHEEKYGEPSPWIQDQLTNSRYDITLLCYPDLPWVEDPQRENPSDRDRLYLKYQNELNTRKETYFVVKGVGSQRIDHVLGYLKQKGHITK